MHRPDNYEQWQHAEERREQHDQKRQQAELFDEFTYRAASAETPDEREVRLFYAAPEVCACTHVRGMHDFPMGECMETGCGCHGFNQAAARKPAAGQPGRNEEAA